MSKVVKIGVVGCGSVLEKYMKVAERLRGQVLAQVIAACDVVAAKREEMLQQYGIQWFSTDYRELLNLPDVDLVLVLSSMQEHGPIARAALEAGKHVLVEKPMAVTLDVAAQLVDIAKSSPGYLVPAPHVLLSATYQKIWRRVHNGDVGKILSARALYG